MRDIYFELQKIFESSNFALLLERCTFYGKLYPDDLEILNYLGRCLLLKKDFQKCEHTLKKILNLAPNHLEANLNLARVYSNIGNLDLSIHFYKYLLNLDKSYFVYYELGAVFLKKKDFNNSVIYLKEALKIKPDLPEAYFDLGLIYLNFNNLVLSLKYFTEAIRYKKDYAGAYNNLGLLYVELKDLEKAIFFYNEAIKYSPSTNYFYTNLAQVYLAKGEFNNVRLYINKALKINPADGEAHRILSVITNYSEENEHISQMTSLFKSITLENDSKMHLSFALAKAYEEKKDFKSSASFLLVANKIRRKKFNFDINDEIEQFELFKNYFSKDFFSRHVSTGFKSNKPIFIVGMPRSGTSLVEQIISSHPDVYGGGELSYLANIINKYFTQTLPKDFFNCVAKENDSTFNKIGEDYANLVSKISNNKNYVTDKMPVNFRLIGFIKIALPNAKVIHCNRLAKDTCFSIYKNYFGKDVIPWAYDQKELALYYNHYANLMDFWNNVLPDFIYNISYEALIKNQEHESKKLISYCNLSWDDSCLNFHKNKRSVSTASANQVRKNIYSSSINSWKNYENEFSELFKSID